MPLLQEELPKPFIGQFLFLHCEKESWIDLKYQGDQRF